MIILDASGEVLEVYALPLDLIIKNMMGCKEGVYQKFLP
jgi:hypothetical protein